MYALTPKAKGGQTLDATVELVQCQEQLEVAVGGVDAAPSNEEAIGNLAQAYANLISAEVAMEEIAQTQNPEPITPTSFMNKTVEGAMKVGQGFESLKSLKPEVQMRILRPKDHQRAGRIIQRMNRYEAKAFTRDDINNVILSLIAFDDTEMDAAFQLWAGEDGRIDADEFKEVVPLLGENLTE